MSSGRKIYLKMKTLKEAQDVLRDASGKVRIVISHLKGQPR